MPPASPSSEGQTLARRAGVVAGFTLLSRVFGYVRDAVLAHIFGAGAAFDAFVAAQAIPSVLRRLVGEGSLLIAFVPILAEERENGGKEAMRKFTGAVLGALIPVLLGLVALGVAFPEIWVEAFASGFDPERKAIAVRLTRVVMPFLVFISLAAVASGVLNTEGIFGPPAAAPIFLNIGVVVSAVVLTPLFDLPIESVAWGFVAGGALQLLIQVPFVMRLGQFVWPRVDMQNPALRKLAVRLLPAVLGVAAYQLNVIIIRQIASYLPGGQLSCYFWASRLEEFALGVFAVSISVAALPTLSEHAAKGDGRAVLDTFGRALRATNFITLPAAVGLFVLAEPIVGVLFTHGEFSSADGALTAALLRIMAFAVVPIGWVRVLVPTYYAVGDTKTPVWAALISMVITGAVGAATMHAYEIRGLTLATVLAAAGQAVWLGLLVQRRIHAAVPSSVGQASVLGPAAVHASKSAIAMIPGAALCFWGASAGPWLTGNNLLLAAWLAALVGGTVVLYFGAAKVLGLPEVGLIAGAVTRRFRR